MLVPKDKEVSRDFIVKFSQLQNEWVVQHVRDTPFDGTVKDLTKEHM